MWTDRLTSHPWRTGFVAALLLVGLMAAIIFWPSERGEPVALRECLRSELDLRDGVLFVKDGDVPFTGNLIEIYTTEDRKLEIGIRNGKVDGLSRGWYEDGQLETEEHFVDGISDGLRTRWHPNGVKKSETEIVDGRLSGHHIEWHDNGTKAAEAIMVDGQPEGLVESWHPSGKLKSRVVYEKGVATTREFFEDVEPIAQAAPSAVTTAP